MDAKKRRFLILLAIVLALSAVLCSCGGGKLKGTYEAERFGTGVRLTFRGSNVTVEVTVLGEAVNTLKGTYDVTDTTIRFDFPEAESEDTPFSGEYSFSQTDKTLIIDGEEYTKVS